MLFEEGWGRVEGFFLPVAVGWNSMGHPAEDVVRAWYDENDSLLPKPIDKIWKNSDLLKLVEKTLSPTERPFYLWTYTNGITADNQNPDSNGLTSVTECDEYAYSHEEEADAWLRKRHRGVQQQLFCRKLHRLKCSESNRGSGWSWMSDGSV